MLDVNLGMMFQLLKGNIATKTSYQKQVFLKEYARAEGVSAGFGVDLESASDLSCGIGVSETVESTYFRGTLRRLSTG